MVKIVLSIFIGSLIGYITNWLAIKMLFKPYKRLYLFGFPVPFTPGVIPKEREKIAKSISETLEKYILPEEKIKEILERSNYRENLHKRVEMVIEEIIETLAEDIKSNIKNSLTIGKLNIKATFVLGIVEKTVNNVIDKIKSRLKQKLVSQASNTIEKHIEEEIPVLVSNLNLKDTVEETLLSIDIKNLEFIILGITKNQLKHITMLGGLIGGLIGLIQGIINLII